MNEATFEARVNAEIERLFPSISKLKITHQKHLSLRVGHSVDIETGGARQALATGRLDILLSFEDKPLAVLELKKPGESLTIDDRDQGLSYAKLLTPQAPLVIVSNGEDAEFYQTFDGEFWKPKTKDEKAIENVLSHALSIAAGERKDAIQLLMGKQPSMWQTLFKKFTKMTLDQLSGDLDDYTRPLTNCFSIKRSIGHEIIRSIIDGKQLVALVGPPISGKTNVLSQVCMTEDVEGIIPIYIDARNSRYGIFQHIANQFTRELYVHVQPQEIRQWIFHSTESISGRLAIIIDGWTADISGTLEEDVDELINFLHLELPVSILLCMDDTVYHEIKNIPGKPTRTLIGRDAEVIQLNSLGDDEFQTVRNIFYEKYRTGFHHGSQYNLDFRNPRLLRIIANLVSNSGNEPIPKEGYTAVNFIPSITTFSLIFDSWKRYIFHPKIEGFYRDLANAYLLDKNNRRDNPTLNLMSHGKGHIVRETAERVIPYEKINEMLAQGHIGFVKGPRGKDLILPKIPEFLATAASYVIADEAINISKTKDFDDVYEYVVNESDSFPYGDLVGARAIIEISMINYDLANDITNRLIEDEPKESRISEGNRGEIYFEGIGSVKIYFGKGIDEPIVSNIQPWNILSQISTYSIQADPKTAINQLLIFARVGSYPGILLRPYELSVRQMSSFHVHELAEYGSVLCHRSGLIEPIAYSMQCGFYKHPKSMLRLCKFAKEKELFFLAYRLNTVAMTVEGCIDDKVDRASKEAQKILKPVISELINIMCSDIKPSRTVKVGRNEPCPCGSGKKFKKCCGR